MDLLERLLGHDAWTTDRLLDIAGALSDEELDREFDIALRSLRATFRHVIRNMEAWSDLMNGVPIRPDGGVSADELKERLRRAAKDLAEVSRAVAARDGWDERWTDPEEDPPVERSYGGSIAHVITHSMHHRGQIIFMLRRLGVEDVPEGDVLSWERSLR